MNNKVPTPTLQRLPAYLQLLKRFKSNKKNYISCNDVAREMNLNPVTVRKDIAAVSKVGGRPKVGYSLDALILDVEQYLGYKDLNKAALVGVGHLGSALLAYPGFSAYGIGICAAFDTNPEIIGKEIAGHFIRSASEIAKYCRENNIKLGIITVPASNAQYACDELIKGGVKGIWSFAPTILKASSEVLIQHEDMAIPLAMLSKHIETNSFQ